MFNLPQISLQGFLQFWQRLTRNQKFALISLLVLLLALPVGVYLSQKTQIFKPKAQETPANFYGTNINFLKMFGQKSFGETSPNKVTANGVFHASGVIVDKSSTPNKVYVVDTGNNRILGFDGTDGDGTKPADMVFGQPDFTTGSCNGDNNLGINQKPTASTLCLVGYPYVTNLAEYWMRSNVDVDSEGNLYVVDVWNNRILKYNDPFSNDKSDGKGDNVADFVWGQENFDSNGINKGSSGYYSSSATPNPDNTSLWTSFGFGTTDHVSSRGVSVDQQGNVWVADTFNNRVLRFPSNSKVADLVLGQPDFTSSGCSQNQDLNKMCAPTLAKVMPETGDLYIIDEHSGFRTRILVFKAPFTNGMSADKVIQPQYGQFANSQINFGFSATGFAFNTYKEGEYANGTLWVNELGPTRTILIDDDGNIIKVIGTYGKEYIGGEHEIPSICGATSSFAKKNLWTSSGILDLWTPGGSIGFDNENNIYLAEDLPNRVMRYSLPYEPRTVEGQTCLPEPNGGLFPIEQPGVIRPNIRSSESFSSGIGVAVFRNQLVIQDSGLKVFNNYQNKLNGSSPDMVVGNLTKRSFTHSSIDERNRLWLFDQDGFLQVYQLPFEGNDQPRKDRLYLYWNDDGRPLMENQDSLTSAAIAFDRTNNALYIADKNNNRVLRVTNYNDLFDENISYKRLRVDMVIGQPDKNSVACSAPSADRLCDPSNLDFDRFGNLYVVENDYECRDGNARISIFMADDLKNAQGLFPNTSAQKTILGSLTSKGSCADGTVNEPGSPVAIAFDSKNQMAVGNDGYYGTGEDRHLKQLWLYSDPITRQTPDAYISIPLGASGDLTFDSQDNLIVQDHTWSKTWIINLDRDSSWVKWLRTVPVPSPVPSPTPTPSPTPSLSPSPSQTPTSASQTITFAQGWNLIGLTVDKGEDYKAEDFLRDLNANFTPSNVPDKTPPTGDKVFIVYSFKSRWLISVAGRTNVDNFPIIPGEGYLVFTLWPGTASITGITATRSSIPIGSGWSLISIPPNGCCNYVEALLQMMYSQGIDARKIARWSGGRYAIYNIGSDPNNFSNNFLFRTGEGYWIRNFGDAGTFTLP